MKNLPKRWSWRWPASRALHLLVVLIALPGFYNRRSGCVDGSRESDAAGQGGSKALPAAGTGQFAFGDGRDGAADPGKASWSRSLLSASSE